MVMQDSISHAVWDAKYRYRWHGKVIDETVTDTWQRVAKAIACAEKASERKHWQSAFESILTDYQFLPGGRILAGAGTRHQVTLFNCFVMNIASDSLSGIFNGLKEGALTLQQGGGVGYDFSVLRPRGSLVQKTGAPSSGPVSFMKVWDAMCDVLLSTGMRRGAMMAVMRCDHPDILEFIRAKHAAGVLRHFNVSVLVTDAFMEAVRQNQEWVLRFPCGGTDGSSERIESKINARVLWQEIIRSAYDCAEPGVLFGDTINRMNTLWYRESISATNPCGEIPLPSYGACNLGSINLTQFVVAPFSHQAVMNWSALEDAVSIATRFLDDVIDVSKFPLKAQRAQAIGTRRVGLGVTGLADCMLMLSLRYGSEASLVFAKELMRRIAEVTWETSIQLAKEKGAFPYYHDDYLRGEFVVTLDERLRQLLVRHQVRNSHHNTIAPAGTISLFANNVSNGIEPIFRASYDRHMRDANDQVVTYQVEDYACGLWRQLEKAESLPPHFADAACLLPEAHLEVQGVMQPYIDNAISKTINIPKDFPFEKLADVYTRAHALGLKGCTVFRPNAITGAILEEKSSDMPAIDHCC